jgi:phage-related protein
MSSNSANSQIILPEIATQTLVTNSVVDLYEFDFTTIGGTAKVYIANGQETDGSGGYQKVDISWDDEAGVQTFEWIDTKISGLRADLTGQIAEPTLEVAAYDLWQISAWATATSGFSMPDYVGLGVNRKRLFYNIVFTLTPSLGTENGNKPSARKFEV